MLVLGFEPFPLGTLSTWLAYDWLLDCFALIAPRSELSVASGTLGMESVGEFLALIAVSSVRLSDHPGKDFGFRIGAIG